MASARRGTPARDYYEVLELSGDANDDAVRRAYRKLALVWHPDKNLHRPDEAHVRFQEIQNAYAVLSDRSERAWYDAHKDAILRGSGSGDDGEDQLINLFSYFTPSAYGEYDDSPTGFYTVFRKLFEQLAAEEQRFAADGFNAAEFVFPRFGTPDFYDFWCSYTSRMSFAWVDEHNPNEAPNRYVRRAMEKDNKKLRDAARRERSDEIHALANFVKRRDKRFMTAAVDAKKRSDEEAAARRRAAEARAVATSAAAAERKEYIAREAEVYHAEMRAMSGFRLADADEDARGGRKGKRGATVVKRAAVDTPPAAAEAEQQPVEGGAAPEEEDVEDVYWCDVCAKEFRTAGQMQSHERSKKHLAAVVAAELQAAADEEDVEADGAADEADDAVNAVDEAVITEDDEDEDAELPLEVLLGTPAKDEAASSSSESSDDDDDDVDIAERFARMRVGRPRKATPPEAVAETSDSSSHSDDDATPAPPADAPVASVAAAVAAPVVEETEEPAAKAKKRRRAAKPAAAAALPPASGISGEAQFRVVEDATLLVGGSKGVPMQARANAADVTAMLEREHCAVCGQDFPTRNKLFAHIKKTGHAVVKAVGAAAAPVSRSRAAGDDEDEDGGRGRRSKGKRR